MKREISRKPAAKICIILIWVVAGALLLRLFLCAAEFSRGSLQQDFSAFYTAGEALNHGLDPYQNHLNHEPPVWDGMNLFKHSRFLYPPLVATIFQPIALMPYSYAKILWTAASLAFLAGAFFLLMRIGDTWRRIFAAPWILPIFIIFISLYHPLLTHLERGQIDTLTLLFFVLAIFDLAKGRKIRAGAWFALATLLKLHSVYVLPFLLLRRNWKTLGGYLLSGAIILAVSFFVNGPLLTDYLVKELPEISLRGERGTYDDLLPGRAVMQKLGMLEENRTDKGGIIYRADSFPFEQNASLVRIIGPFVPLTMSAVSIIVFACIFLIVAFWMMYARRDTGEKVIDQEQEVIFWQIVMIVILLSGPLTWVMNAVWLLPALFIIASPSRGALAGIATSGRARQKHAQSHGEQTGTMLSGGGIWRIMAILALILAALPDLYFFNTLPFRAWPTQKCVIAEIILLISLCSLMRSDAFRENNPSDDESPPDQ